MAPSSQETNADFSSGGDHPAAVGADADNRSNDDNVATTPPKETDCTKSQYGSESSPSSSPTSTVAKCALAAFLLYCALVGGRGRQQQQQQIMDTTTDEEGMVNDHRRHRRRLTMVGDDVPKYMEPLMKDLRDRQKLFDETPPEEVKYWFEYTGPLQVSQSEIYALFL